MKGTSYILEFPVKMLLAFEVTFLYFSKRKVVIGNWFCWETYDKNHVYSHSLEDCQIVTPSVFF